MRGLQLHGTAVHLATGGLRGQHVQTALGAGTVVAQAPDAHLQVACIPAAYAFAVPSCSLDAAWLRVLAPQVRNPAHRVLPSYVVKQQVGARQHVPPAWA
jgi:hypothetical protein